MEITQEHFLKMVEELAERNSKVKSLINSCGGYEKLPQNIKNLIDKELKVKRKIVLYIEE